MKIFRLIYMKLKVIIKQNTLVFVFLCIGLIACDLMFIYTFGVYRNFLLNYDIPDYYIEYAGGDTLDLNSMSCSIKSVVSVSDIDFYFFIDSNSSEYGDTAIDGNEYIVRTSTNIDDFVVFRGELSKLHNIGSILIPESIYDSSPGDSVIINGVSFVIAGSIISDNYFLTSVDTMEKFQFPVIAATVHIGDNGKMIEKLQTAFGKNYHVSYFENTALKRESRNNLYSILALYVICAITFLFFCTYLYEDSSYEFNIYEILGATKFHIIAILLGTIVSILTLAYSLSVCIHYFLYDIFFQNLFSEKYIYTIGDYGIIYLMSISVISLFITIWLIIKTRRSMIVNSRNMIR